MSSKAVFLDRDGVINVDINYAHTPEQITFIDGIFDFCSSAKAMGYKLIVITNQAGIGRGFYTEETFHALMDWMFAQFAENNVPLDAYYFCPHHPEYGVGEYKQDCNCRKPKPGMIIQAAGQWDIDLAQSILIGDKQSDIAAAIAAGMPNYILFEGQFPILESH
jgi:D-glycero-D-manno-heptose 1,7-bisphosphate phosphatase